jgi:putative transcriptional regulator
VLIIAIDIILVTSRNKLDVKKIIGGLIWEFPLLTGLTQEQFAAYLGVTYATINRWENGRSSPSPMAMDKIEQKLGKWGEQSKELLQKYLRN